MGFIELIQLETAGIITKNNTKNESENENMKVQKQFVSNEVQQQTESIHHF
jgi:hypothetical protein